MKCVQALLNPFRRGDRSREAWSKSVSRAGGRQLQAGHFTVEFMCKPGELIDVSDAAPELSQLSRRRLPLALKKSQRYSRWEAMCGGSVVSRTPLMRGPRNRINAGLEGKHYDTRVIVGAAPRMQSSE
jgi:hypothetical protein